jgi:hypothetical protein
MEDDPIEEPFTPALQVVHQVVFLRLRQRLLLPVLARLGQQRVVIRVVVAEDETPLAVGDVPCGEMHALLPRDLAEDAPGNIDAVRHDG